MSHSPPELQPDAVAATLDEAMQAFHDQRPQEAERLAAAVLAANPGHIQAAWILGQVLLAEGRAADAIAPLREAAQLSPGPALETLLGRALAETGAADEALEHLRLAASRRPPFELAFLELAERLSRLGRLTEAQPILETGLALFPGSAALAMSLGYLHQASGDLTAARAIFTTLAAAHPARHDAPLALAAVLARQGDPAAAATLYARALDQRPDDPMTRVELAKCLLEIGQQHAGEAALRDAARAEPALTGLAITALTASPKGRAFLRPSAAAAFLRGDGV